MESIIERLGIYEFFTDLLVGLITLTGFICFGPVEWLLLFITKTNLHYINKMLTKNEFIASCIFIIISYFLGMIVHETAGLPEKVILRFSWRLPDSVKSKILLRTYSRCNYATDKNVITTGSEREQYYNELFPDLSFASLDKSSPEKTQEDYFLKALTYLELNGKDGKIHRIDSLFGMSRSLAYLSFVFAIYFLLNNKIILFAAALILGILFYMKSYWYINYRTREILRQYRYLHNNKTPL